MSTERVNVGTLPAGSRVLINTGLHKSSNEFRVISKQEKNSVLYTDNYLGVGGRRFWDDAVITATTAGAGETIFDLIFEENLETYLAGENGTFVVKNPNGIAVRYGGHGTVCSGGCFAGICHACGGRGCDKGGHTHFVCPVKTVGPGTIGCNNSQFQEMSYTQGITKWCWTFSSGFYFYRVIPVQNCTVNYQNEYIGGNPKFII
jgi:hypothetical protein